jgi:hypothetical protein
MRPRLKHAPTLILSVSPMLASAAGGAPSATDGWQADPKAIAQAYARNMGHAHFIEIPSPRIVEIGAAARRHALDLLVTSPAVPLGSDALAQLFPAQKLDAQTILAASVAALEERAAAMPWKADEYRRMADTERTLSGSLQPFLVRGVASAGADGRFAALWEGDELLLWHIAPMPDNSDLQHRAVVVFLEKAPAEIHAYALDARSAAVARLTAGFDELGATMESCLDTLGGDPAAQQALASGMACLTRAQRLVQEATAQWPSQRGKSGEWSPTEQAWQFIEADTSLRWSRLRAERWKGKVGAGCVAFLRNWPEWHIENNPDTAESYHLLVPSPQPSTLSMPCGP